MPYTNKSTTTYMSNANIQINSDETALMNWNEVLQHIRAEYLDETHHLPWDENILDDNYLNDLPLWADTKAQKRLEEVCAKHNIPVKAITELVMVQRERQYLQHAVANA